MTHLTTILMMGALALAACGGSKQSAANPGEVPSAVGENLSPAPPPAIACEREIALVCGDGAQDGCLDGKTTAHVCVTADAAATVGPTCTQKLALNCAQGQYDACLRPGMAANHICVFDPTVE